MPFKSRLTKVELYARADAIEFLRHVWGLEYKEIGKIFKISTQMVHQIYKFKGRGDPIEKQDRKL